MSAQDRKNHQWLLLQIVRITQSFYCRFAKVFFCIAKGKIYRKNWHDVDLKSAPHVNFHVDIFYSVIMRFTKISSTLGQMCFLAESGWKICVNVAIVTTVVRFPLVAIRNSQQSHAKPFGRSPLCKMQIPRTDFFGDIEGRFTRCRSADKSTAHNRGFLRSQWAKICEQIRD